MNIIRLIFSECVHLVRACWRVYFEANPGTFREGDISRSFSESVTLATGVGQWLAKTITTTGRLHLKTIGISSDIASGGLGSAGWFVKVYVNGEEAAHFDGNPAFAAAANLLLGPGEIKFYAYQDSGADRYCYINAECWERDEENNVNRVNLRRRERETK